jgi:membrane-bound inhibitor of C-type lysozyme
MEASEREIPGAARDGTMALEDEACWRSVMMWRFSRPALWAAWLLGVSALPVSAETPVATATFKCEAGKTIEATFYASAVDLKLSDGRSLKLPQAMSASGARYANADESFVFWNKGNTAFITEGKDGKETFSGCVTK